MNEHYDVLARVSEIVLENWAMMLVDIPDESSPPAFSADGGLFRADAHFTDEESVEGEVRIFCNGAAASIICRNVMGMDEDEEVDEQQVEDILKELANVFAGHFVTEQYGIDAPFHLSPPSVRKISVEEATACVEPDGFWAVAEDQPIFSAPTQNS